MYKKAKLLFACRDQSTLFLPNTPKSLKKDFNAARIYHFTMLLNGTFMQFSLNMLESSFMSQFFITLPLANEGATILVS